MAEFAHQEASSGIILMACALIAVILANSAAASQYFDFWQTPISFGAGESAASKTLIHWINDGLMAVFFLLVGLEIKREVLIGQLSSVRRAALPVFAAIGGMVVPALIYFGFNMGTPAAKGWGVPMATDIAFALGVLALLGSRVPFSLKVFLTAVAIVDDIGAVLVIAIFYTHQMNLTALAAAGVFLATLIAMNKLEVRSLAAYAILGFFLWAAVLGSGIHATIAGVLMAFTIPTRVHLNPAEFAKEARETIEVFEKDGCDDEEQLLKEDQQTAVRALERACEEVQMPLERMENYLHLWVAFLIVPLFALANAGVAFAGFSDAMTDKIGLGVLLGLVIGKPIGIALFSYLAVVGKLADLPSDVCWRQIIGTGVLAGIGFTMSLFITELAFTDAAHSDIAKVSILVASVVAGTIGYAMLFKPYRCAPLPEPAGAH